MTNGLAQALPGKIITHAPQTPYWDTTYNNAPYAQIWKQAGDKISWINNQFYSSGYPYDDTDADKVSWYEKIAAIVGSSKLMMGVA